MGISKEEEPPQLNSSAEAFHPLQAAIGETFTTGTPTNHTTCGVTKEAEGMPRPGIVDLQMIPVILEGENGTRIRANAFLDGGSGSVYLKEEIADILGLDAERKPPRVAVFGATSIVTREYGCMRVLRSVYFCCQPPKFVK